MDQRLMVWPVGQTGAWLAKCLREAAYSGQNVMNGTAGEIVAKYLDWVAEQVRMLQGGLGPLDLDRLLTTPRYWATVANPMPTGSTTNAVMHEVQHRLRMLEATATEVASAADAWQPLDAGYTNYALADTNFWVEHQGSFGQIDWHDLLESTPGPGRPNMQDELRIVVPMLVIDELDGLSHRKDMRPKVSGAMRYLSDLLGTAPWRATQIRPASAERGEVRIQVLFDSLQHVRLPNSDDEHVDRLRAVRDFVGSAPTDNFFVTYDNGAAFRATAAGHMTRLLKK